MARASVLFGLALAAATSLALGLGSACKGGGGAGGGNTTSSGGTCLDGQRCYSASLCYKPGPTRSFANDVVPIFEASCVGDFTCHGNGQAPFLGPQSGMLGPNDVMLIYTGLVGRPASETTGESYVEPSKPGSSFLMQKIDQALGCATIGCKANALGCGHGMPNNGTVLSVDKRDVVRDWISQGAMNN